MRSPITVLIDAAVGQVKSCRRARRAFRRRRVRAARAFGLTPKQALRKRWALVLINFVLQWRK